MFLIYPDSQGRDSTQRRRPSPATEMPPRRLDAPETTSEVIGDFHEPKGAVSLSCSTGPETSTPWEEDSEEAEQEEAILLWIGRSLLVDNPEMRSVLRGLKIIKEEEAGEVEAEAEQRARVDLAAKAIWPNRRFSDLHLSWPNWHQHCTWCRTPIVTP